MKKTSNIKFAIFCNTFIGEIKSASSIEELLETKILKRQKNWSVIKYTDSQNRTISITQEYIEQGMSIQEIIDDHILFGNINEEIMCLNPRGSGTVII